MHRVHLKNVDRSKRTIAFTFVFDPLVRWSEAVVSIIGTFTNPLNCVTSPYRSRSQNKTLMNRDRFTMVERDAKRCASRRQLSASARSAIYTRRRFTYRARVTLCPIGRRSETSWSYRHLVAGAASLRDHEVSVCRPIERSVGCRCSLFAESFKLRNARFSN